MLKRITLAVTGITLLGVFVTPAVALAPAPQEPQMQQLTTAKTSAPETPILNEEITFYEEKPPPPPEPVKEDPKPEAATKTYTPPANLPAPEPGTAQAFAKELLTQRGFGESDYSCLVNLWNRESGWNYKAMNPSSGAYGIPQSLPGNKMAAAGSDWQTNPETQIRWGLDYIQNRYQTPCGAWQHSELKNWY